MSETRAARVGVGRADRRGAPGRSAGRASPSPSIPPRGPGGPPLGASAAPCRRAERVRRAGVAPGRGGGRGRRGAGASRRGHVTGLSINTAGAPAAAPRLAPRGVQVPVGAGDPGDEPGRSGASGPGRGCEPETRWPRLQLSSRGGLGRSGWGPGWSCRRLSLMSLAPLETLGPGAPPSVCPPRLPPLRD